MYIFMKSPRMQILSDVAIYTVQFTLMLLLNILRNGKGSTTISHTQTMSTQYRADLLFAQLFCQVIFDQWTHDLLRRFGGADEGKNEASMSLLCIAYPT